ncbi:MAG: hypothetical protein HY689_13860 [Chloroflexi bacterium]|nr:hypothetical protein [Chloroflexota bacterium]
MGRPLLRWSPDALLVILAAGGAIIFGLSPALLLLAGGLAGLALFAAANN